MGTMMMAVCECGYESENLFVGAGILSCKEMDAQPALCKSCRRVVLVNKLKAPHLCPKCNNPAQFYTDPSLKARKNQKGCLAENDLCRFPARFLCPKCGKPQLRFTDNGCWD